MAWFGRLQIKRATRLNSVSQDRRNVSPPTEWEVLNREEDKIQKVQSAPTAEVESEDEALFIIEGENDVKNQIEELRKQCSLLQKDKQSLEEDLQQQQNDAEALKESSDRFAARMRSDLNDAHEEVHKSKGEVDKVEQEITKLKEEMKAVAEESHQAQIRARLEMKGTRLLLEEKSQQMAKTEHDNARLVRELEEAKQRIKKLVEESKSLKEILAQQQSNVLLEESRTLKKEMKLLQVESQRVTAQNSQVLAMLGVRSLERGEEYAFATKPDLVSETEVVEMLDKLNVEIFEAAAYMADFFVFVHEPTETDEMREGSFRATKMLGSSMALSLKSMQHDEDPLIIQMACQACMVECCRRIVESWCFDGSKTEEVLPDLYTRIRKAEAHAGWISGRWRALTRTLVRSMLHGQTVDVSSRLIPSFSEAIIDVLSAAGCKGTRNQILEQLKETFNKRLSDIATMALRLNEVIGEKITSCELKAISIPYGMPFSSKTMDDVYDDGQWHGLASELPEVLCTTELGLQKEVRGSHGTWQRVTLTKPKVALKSITNGMQIRE